jgi:hypothetical protein
LDLTTCCYNKILWSKFGVAPTHIQRPEEIKNKYGNFWEKIKEQGEKIKDWENWEDLKNLSLKENTCFRILLEIMVMAIVITIIVTLSNHFR